MKGFLSRFCVDIASQVSLVDVPQPLQEEVLPWQDGV